MYSQLTQYYRKKLEFIKLLGGKCVVCGSNEGLQFHHKDPSKKSFVVTAKYSSLKVYDELKKCELRCVVHHNEMHASTHGTFQFYQRRKCRCQKCVDFYRDKMRGYNQKYKAKLKLRRLAGKDTTF